MSDYTCANCGGTVLLLNEQPTRVCACAADTPVAANMTASAHGVGGVLMPPQPPQPATRVA